MNPTETICPKVVIAGGGLAGLAAASVLVTRGCAVTVLESRPRLGGRASSFLDRNTSEWIDNCQHVSLGCCTNFQDFCRRTRLEQFLRTERELYFIGRDGVVNRLWESSLPAPLHLAGAFQGMSYLTAADRRSIARGIRRLCRWKPSEQRMVSFLDWLNEQRQTPGAIERFWNVILTSALSETLERIDIGHARKVIVDGFLRNRTGWRMQVPTLPLDEFYGKHLRGWLEAKGVEIRLQAGVERVEIQDEKVRSAVLRNGQEVVADQFVLALGPKLISEMVPKNSSVSGDLVSAMQMESAPITSVHLWFDREVCPLPHAVLIERLSQWIFSRDKLQNRTASDKAGHYYQVVISASRNLKGRDQQEVIAEVVDEILEIWPAAREAKLIHSRMVTEHQAVFSVQPGIEGMRPCQQSSILNLQYAGDWTNTGWPGTMEGAVRSGYQAAENILKQLGRPERLVQRDLPTAWLSRLLLGIRSAK